MSETLPALQLVTQLCESAAVWAQCACRNAQQILRYADRCAEIVHGLNESLRGKSSPDLDHLQDLMAISRLEEIMLNLYPTISEEAESASVTTASCSSWAENHRKIWTALEDLYRRPFRVHVPPMEQDTENAAKFDEWVWITQLYEMTRTFRDHFDEERNLIQEIFSLEREFWASNRDTRNKVVEAMLNLISVVGEISINTNSNDDPTLTSGLRKAVGLLRNPDLNTPSDHPSTSSATTPAASEGPEAPVAKASVDIPGILGDQQSLDTILHSLARYRMDEKEVKLTKTVLGRGGFGVVVLGEIGGSFWKRRKGTLVAVKQLQASGTLAENRKLSLALVQELKVWAGLAHPNIIRLDGFFLDDRLNRAWLISPCMKNGNIRRYLDEHKPNMIVRFRMSGEVASGVAYLHQRNICHGDIKGANILVDDHGQAKLCDFGLTKVMESGTIAGMSTTEAKGTTRYMAPELFHNAARTKKSDVWAWSCLGLEILFDEIPYGGVNGNMAVMNRIVHGDPPVDLDRISVDSSIKELFKGCWVAEPRERVNIRSCVDAVEGILVRLLKHQASTNFDEPSATVHRLVTHPSSNNSIPSLGAQDGRASDRDLVTPLRSSDGEGVLNAMQQRATPRADEPSEEIIRLATSNANEPPSIIVVPSLAEASIDAMPSFSSGGVTERGHARPRSTSGEPSSAAGSSHQQIERHRQEPLHGPAQDQSLQDHANAQFTQYRLTKNPTNLNEAIELYRLALLLRPEGHPERHNTLQRLGHAHLDKYFAGDATHLDKGIELFRQILPLLPNNHPERHNTFESLGFALQARYNDHRNVADREEAIDLIRQGLLLLPEGHLERQKTLQSLGSVLRSRYLQQHDVADLDETLDCFRQCLLLQPEEHSQRQDTLQHFADSLLNKYCENGDVTYIDEAIDSYRQILLLLPEGHSKLGSNLFGLATSLVYKYRKDGDAKHLDEAIDLYYRELVLLPQGSSGKLSTIQGLSYALMDKYTQAADGDVKHLDEVINLIRPVLNQLPIGHSDYAKLRQMFDTALVTRSSAAIGSPVREDRSMESIW